jgi:hypothetical protein
MNPDNYTFQQLREQDLLRFCLSSFVHEQKLRARQVHCRKVPAPELPDPRSIIAIPSMQFTDITQIQYECNHVYSDVLELRAELIPLRRRQAELEEELFNIDNRRVLYNRNFQPNARQFPWPRVMHKTTPDLLRVQQEKEAASKMTSKLSRLIESDGNTSFADVIAGHRKHVRALRAQVKEGAQELSELKERIRQMRTAQISEEVRRQNLQIQMLLGQIEREIQVQSALKRDIEWQNGQSVSPSQEMIDSAGENPALLRELDRALKLKRQKAQELEQSTNDQEEAVIVARLKDERRIEKLTAVFVGWLDETIEIENIRDFFEDPQKILSITIAYREYRGGMRRCAYVNWESHEAAKKGMMEIQKRNPGGKKLLIIWNDEFVPTPPSRAPSASSVRHRRMCAKR